MVTIGTAVSEEKSFEIAEGQTIAEPAYTINCPGASSSGELIIQGLSAYRARLFKTNDIVS